MRLTLAGAHPDLCFDLERRVRVPIAEDVPVEVEPIYVLKAWVRGSTECRLVVCETARQLFDTLDKLSRSGEDSADLSSTSALARR